MMQKGYTLLLILLTMVSLVNAIDIPKRPEPLTHVNDFAKLLNSADHQELEKELSGTGQPDYCIVILESIKGVAGEDFAHKIGKSWNIGREGKPNSVLILIAVSERDYFISTSKDLENKLDRFTASKVIRKFLTPEFKNKNYGAGLKRSVQEINGILSGKVEEKELNKSSDTIYLVLLSVMALFFIIILPYLIIQNVRKNNLSGKGFSFAAGFGFFTGYFTQTPSTYADFNKNNNAGGASGSW